MSASDTNKNNKLYRSEKRNNFTVRDSRKSLMMINIFSTMKILRLRSKKTVFLERRLKEVSV